jgi:hypothetical protein
MSGKKPHVIQLVGHTPLSVAGMHRTEERQADGKTDSPDRQTDRPTGGQTEEQEKR